MPEIRYGSFGSTSFLPILSTADRISFGDSATYLTNNHVIKVGAEYNKTSISQIFKGNWRGVYVFAGNNKANLLAGKRTQYFQFGGLNGLTMDQAGTAAFAQKELAFFAQDQWFLSPKLTLTAGIRYERLDNPDRPILNPNDVQQNGSFALDGQIPDQNDKWSPRAGLTYSPDPKTAVRLSLGRLGRARRAFSSRSSIRPTVCRAGSTRSTPARAARPIRWRPAGVRTSIRPASRRSTSRWCPTRRALESSRRAPTTRTP